MCCCCCPPAITALFCLWVQSGFSKGTVAGALTFFPPEPSLYRFERRDENGNPIPDDKDVDDDDGKSKKKKKKPAEEHDLALTAVHNDNDELAQPPPESRFEPAQGETKEKMKSPAQQLTDRANELRLRAKKRNARDARDIQNKVKYTLVLDPRLPTPMFDAGALECVKIPSKKGVHVAAVVYRVPASLVTENTKTMIYSHGNATDVGAMFSLQAIIAHSLECNVVSYDYSGYGESGGVAMEANTYTDISSVYDWTLKNVANDVASNIVLYGQSVGSGPCCHLACRHDNIGGMILHSPFTSGMRVLTPSRYVTMCIPFPGKRKSILFLL
jgi:hypothetical protein